jgi:drug/metabolite transporter, DME family
MPEAGVVAAIGAAAAWATSSTLMATQAARMDSGSISAIRLAWAAIFFTVVLFAAGQQGEVRDMGWVDGSQLILSALLGLAIGDTLYVAAIGMVGMARAFTIALGTFTVLAYAFSIVFLGERVTWAVLVGSALVLAAIYLVALRGRPRSTAMEDELARQLTARRATIGLAIVLIAGACWAGASVWTRSVSIDYGTLAVGSVRLPAAALLVTTYVAFNGASSVRRRAVSKRSAVVLAVAGIIGTGFGSLLYLYALKEIGAGRAAVLSSMSPLFALPLGWLVLKERITVWVAVGTVVAVCGIVLLSS